MKTLFLSFLTVLSLLQTESRANDRVIIMKPEALFTPKGFSNNNNAQVIISGSFGSFCYKVAPPKFKIDVNRFKIYIENKAYLSPGCADALMLIPYSSVVNLGALPVGNYEVFSLGKDKKYTKQADLPITPAILNSQGGDDYLYAPINEASFEVKDGQIEPVLTLKGIFTNTCLSLKNVQVNVREGNVVEVLPFANMATANCKNEPAVFSTEIKLSAFPKDRTLIHIRAMNGQAINKVITNIDRIIRL